MASAISGIGSNFPTYQTSLQSNRAKGQQDFQALSDALSSNDLQAAQTAFATLQKDLPKLSGSQQAGQNANSNNPLAVDFQSLSQALSAGNLTNAQAAYAKLQQDAQAIGGGHHHHHHGASGGSAIPTTLPASNPAGSGSDVDGESDGSTSQTSINVQA